MDKLGGPLHVAEMTGRKGRVERNSQGKGEFRMRAKPDSQEMDSLNVKETGKPCFLRIAGTASQSCTFGLSV